MGLLLAAAPALAGPVIDVSPGRDFPTVTLGDSSSTDLGIKNTGDAPLVVSRIDTPADVIVSQRPPYTIDPGSTMIMTMILAPTDTSTAPITAVIHSNDPADSVHTESWARDVRPLAVETIALVTGNRYPLGEALVIQTAPLPGVRIEQATLRFRNARSASWQSVPMIPNVSTFIAIIPGASVTEGGIEFYVTVVNGGFTATDPADPDRRPYRVDVEPPQNFLLNPVYRTGLTWHVGESIDFLLTLNNGTVFQDGTLHFRRGGDSTYRDIPIQDISFTGIACTIPGLYVGPTGIEYWAEIQTLTTRMVLPGDVDHPSQIRVTVDKVTEAETHPAGRYRLLSIPLEFTSTNGLAAMLSDQPEFGTYDPFRWRAFRWVPEQAANVELSADPTQFTLEPGRAFWLVSRDAHRVDTAPISGLSTRVQPWMLFLQPGWNAIGNPFAFPVAWSAVKHSPGIPDPIAFDPELGDYSDTRPEVLEPFEGYFVNNPSAVVETLTVVPPSPSVRGNAVERAPAPAPIAMVRLGARTSTGVDRSNRIGLASDAADERDALDQYEPPPSPVGAVRLAIANRGWHSGAGLYRRDFRPAGGEGQTWEIEVTSARAGEAVELSIEPQGALPTGSVLAVLDRELGQRVEMGGDGRYTIVSLGPSRAYRLAVSIGTQAFVDGAADVALIPTRLTLEPAAPNPAREAQRIRFGLPRAATVRLEAFDVTGQRVATLLDGKTMTPGFHSVVWRGERDGGGTVASGVYFYRLSVGGESRSARVVFVR